MTTNQLQQTVTSFLITLSLAAGRARRRPVMGTWTEQWQGQATSAKNFVAGVWHFIWNLPRSLQKYRYPHDTDEDTESGMQFVRLHPAPMLVLSARLPT